jgi:prepilin-type N-terminal cleavage/methylation domain-containing protein
MENFCFVNEKKKPRISNGAGFCLCTGFTLVEALAVIAIIGFLASIIVVNIGTSKKQGEDTAVKSALLEVRNAAELYFNKNLTYEGVCKKNGKDLSKDGDFGKLGDYIDLHNGDNGKIGCVATDQGFAVISSLNLGGCWCVDYQGVSRKVELTGPSEKCNDKIITITCP